MNLLPVLGTGVVTSFGDAVVAIVVVETVTQISQRSFKHIHIVSIQLYVYYHFYIKPYLTFPYFSGIDIRITFCQMEITFSLDVANHK